MIYCHVSCHFHLKLLLTMKDIFINEHNIQNHITMVSTDRRCDLIDEILLHTTVTVTFLPSSDVLERQAFLNV